jgi:hypothetical protein
VHVARAGHLALVSFDRDGERWRRHHTAGLLLCCWQPTQPSRGRLEHIHQIQRARRDRELDSRGPSWRSAVVMRRGSPDALSDLGGLLASAALASIGAISPPRRGVLRRHKPGGPTRSRGSVAPLQHEAAASSPGGSPSHASPMCTERRRPRHRRSPSAELIRRWGASQRRRRSSRLAADPAEMPA